MVVIIKENFGWEYAPELLDRLTSIDLLGASVAITANELCVEFPDWLMSHEILHIAQILIVLGFEQRIKPMRRTKDSIDNKLMFELQPAAYKPNPIVLY